MKSVPLAPFAAFRRELQEELSFSDDDVADIHLTGVAEDLSIRQPEPIFLARTTRTRAEINRSLDAAEHDDTWSITATQKAISDICNADVQPEDFTPVAIATPVCPGRLRRRILSSHHQRSWRRHFLIAASRDVP